MPPVRARQRILLLTTVAAVGAMLLLICSAAGGRPARGTTAADGVPRGQSPQCADQYSATRDPANPLMLPVPPGSNPLSGANFYVDGPAHGAVAGAIAQLLGAVGGGGRSGRAAPRTLSQFPDDLSWASYRQRVDNRIQGQSGAAVREIQLLEKIADEPAAQRFR